MLIVRTEKELEKALESKEKSFLMEGPKANQIVKKFEEAVAKKRRTKRTATAIGILSILAIPFTGGASLLGLGATAGAVALSETVIIAIISAVVSISVAAINGVRDYKLKKLDNERILFELKTSK